MKKKFDDIERILEGELDREAQSIKEDLEKNPPAVGLTDEAKERMKANIDKGIKHYNKEAVYSKLSKEDREALELGKQMKAQQNEAQRTGTDGEFTEEIELTPEVKKVVRKKRSWKAYVGLAAVLVMTMAVSMNSIGVPDKIVQVFKEQIGGRDVSKVNTGEDIAKSAEEREEEAYQEIKKTFGVEPVRIVGRPDDMLYKSIEIDEPLQTINLYYTYKNQTIVYGISLDYTNASWGVGAQDSEVGKWQEIVGDCEMEISEYNTPETGKKRYYAQFVFNKIGYSINGTMKKEDIMIIVENLHFL